ncbi:flavin monoamine oxidase family protein [Photobacterium sp. TY1-4]|uniref:flavin monoamine oxidase family protein n=1 Tax=Photobacterium sp. TY1-4 TaxID=2899122 RepID=UPI0021BE12A3|nr:FAD-dependent oxidoreductase [Photobacterium sp. TY1-4]UXI03707.1 FAD-dependent oxidoreductase [Photobacterium sp. TY1-4]
MIALSRQQRQQRLVQFRQALHQCYQNHMYRQQQTLASPVACTPQSNQSNDALSVGIVGGGMAGMYASMLLAKLGIHSQIFEASGERIGGRVYTHYFNNEPHQYAELGAMRFPHNELQSRLFNFWDYLNTTVSEVENAREIPRIPYILFDSNEATPDTGNLLCFNGMPPVTRTQAEADNSLLGFDPFFEGPEYAYFKDADGKLKSASVLLDLALEPFVALFENENIEVAWAEILKYNRYSARGYLQDVGDGVQPYPVEIVDYMETVNAYTGIYDLSFIELVLDTYSFDESPEWSAMEGGTSRIAAEMANRIPGSQFKTGTRVTTLREESDQAYIEYNTGDGTLTESAAFDRVIVTLPFSQLRFVDTPASWSAGKYQAIRSLKMTNAVKVALGFRTRFWEQQGPYSQGMEGGQSNTDLASRSIVYPSFGIGESGPAYLLSSYSWQNDADKFSHLSEAEALEATLRDVVHLHGDIARQEYLGHGTAVVWNRQELAGGGFEFFAAGQFEKLFVAAREPEGRFNFAGEHLDMVHYWIAGSYNAAFRTVWEILIQEGLDTQANLETLFSALGGGDILPTMIPHFNRHSHSTLLEIQQNLQNN